jgi:hypothetical protein
LARSLSYQGAGEYRSDHGVPAYDLAATLICRIVTLWFAVVIGWIAVGCLKIQDKHCKKQQGMQARI